MTTVPLSPAPVKKRNPAELALSLAAKREYGLLVVIALITLAATLRDSSFLSPLNIRDILVNCTQPAIVACGVIWIDALAGVSPGA